MDPQTPPPDGGAPARPCAPFAIRPAVPADVAAIHAMIAALAEFERLSHLCVATEADLAAALFGPQPAAEVLIAAENGVPAGFALVFP